MVTAVGEKGKGYVRFNPRLTPSGAPGEMDKNAKAFSGHVESPLTTGPSGLQSETNT